MPDRQTGYVVEPATIDGHLAVVVRPPENPWYQPLLPVAPGVVVALFGLWAAHHFAVQRDRRKEIGESCEKTKAAAETAAAAASAAWLCAGPDAATKTIDAKAKIQSLGIKATNLKRLSARTGLLWHRRLFGMCCQIDVLAEVSALRQVATADPFEDGSREADRLKALEAGAQAAALQSAIDLQYASLYLLSVR